jgi:hypothetical protein
MRRVSIWASGLLASAIPFIFVGAAIALLACIFDAVGQHAPLARSTASFQPEAAPLEEALAIATADAPDDTAQRQPDKRQAGKHQAGKHQAGKHQAGKHQAGKHVHRDARHHHARSRSQSRMRHSALVNQYQWATSAPWSRSRLHWSYWR